MLAKKISEGVDSSPVAVCVGSHKIKDYKMGKNFELKKSNSTPLAYFEDKMLSSLLSTLTLLSGLLSAVAAPQRDGNVPLPPIPSVPVPAPPGFKMYVPISRQPSVT